MGVVDAYNDEVDVIRSRPVHDARRGLHDRSRRRRGRCGGLWQQKSRLRLLVAAHRQLVRRGRRWNQLDDEHLGRPSDATAATHGACLRRDGRRRGLQDDLHQLPRKARRRERLHRAESRQPDRGPRAGRRLSRRVLPRARRRLLATTGTRRSALREPCPRGRRYLDRHVTDDATRAARYMVWMALGGTEVIIPSDVLQIVDVTPVFGVPRDLGTTSANMLASAKGLCESLLGQISDKRRVVQAGAELSRPAAERQAPLPERRCRALAEDVFSLEPLGRSRHHLGRRGDGRSGDRRQRRHRLRLAWPASERFITPAFYAANATTVGDENGKSVSIAGAARPAAAAAPGRSRPRVALVHRYVGPERQRSAPARRAHLSCRGVAAGESLRSGRGLGLAVPDRLHGPGGRESLGRPGRHERGVLRVPLRQGARDDGDSAGRLQPV